MGRSSSRKPQPGLLARIRNAKKDWNPKEQKLSPKDCLYLFLLQRHGGLSMNDIVGAGYVTRLRVQELHREKWTRHVRIEGEGILQPSQKGTWVAMKVEELE